MSANTDERDDPGGYANIIKQARLQMYYARNKYHQAISTGSGSVSWNIRQLLATRLLQYYDALFEYKTKNQATSQAWNESDVDLIPQLAEETREIKKPSPGRGGGSDRAEVPALVAVPPSKLVALSKELDQLSNSLGQAAKVEEGTKIGRIGTPEDFE